MILPAEDFDPSEAAVSWQLVTAAGHEVIFATPDGKLAKADPLMLSGEGLDIWGFIPILRKLKIVGNILRANKDARIAYSQMEKSSAFQNPITWNDTKAENFDALFVPGGHCANGMCSFLESKILQDLIVGFFKANKPVGSVCHGPLLIARSIDPSTGKSVLFGRKTTALTWQLEKTAAMLGKVVRFWDPNYYRTYLEAAGQKLGDTSTQTEITGLIGGAEFFQDVPKSDANYKLKTNGITRDTQTNQTCSFVVQDGNYVSARWPGDIHALGKAFIALL
jgi:putative intracellular protease/amidase